MMWLFSRRTLNMAFESASSIVPSCLIKSCLAMLSKFGAQRYEYHSKFHRLIKKNKREYLQIRKLFQLLDYQAIADAYSSLASTFFSAGLFRSAASIGSWSERISALDFLTAIVCS